MSEMKEMKICAGCAVRWPHEHRCHGGNCQCIECAAVAAQAELTTLRAELEAAHKSDGLNIDRIRELSAELAQVQVDYQVALKQGAEQARIAGNWQVQYSELEAELAQCRGELERLTPGYAEVCQQNVALEAERDTLKGENERLKGDVVEADRIAQNAAETEQQTANRASRIEQHCLNLSKQLTSHRLLLDEMAGVLKPYADLNIHAKAALTKYQQQCGEKV